MPQVTELSVRDITPQAPLHLFEQCERLEKTGAGALDFATIVLDASGIIRYCDPEVVRLFGASTYMLLGQPIAALIPDLPLKANTPGYNIAYASFHSSAGSQRRFSGVHSQGRRFGLDVALAALKIEGGYHIRLNLRQAPAPYAATTQFAGRGGVAAARVDIELRT